MPLTASLADGTVLDSTEASDVEWKALHRSVGARKTLRCRDCRGRMHAKVSVKGLRFFAHDSRPDACPSEGEGPEHRELKRQVAAAIRAAGGQAAIEARPSPTDLGGWRADVLATGTDGRRVAFEVQLAGMTVEEGVERTSRYAADGIATVWVSTKHTHWMTRLPSMHLTPGAEGQLLADRGLARLSLEESLTWQAAGTVDVTKIVHGVLAGRVTTVRLPTFSEPTVGRSYAISDAVLLVSTRDASMFGAAMAVEAARRRKEQEAEAREQLRREQELQDEAKHARRIALLYERQERVLQHALHDALQEGVPDHRVWLGTPVRWWNGKYPAPVLDAVGNEATAQGAVIWTGESPSQLRLWGVICPVASRITPGLGRSWARRSVLVYVETEREADRIAKSLAWARTSLRVAPVPSDSDPPHLLNRDRSDR